VARIDTGGDSWMQDTRRAARSGRGWGRLAVIAGFATASVALTAGSAAAHVSVTGEGAVQGGFAVITFGVPTESETASTVGLKVQMPANQPLAVAAVQPKPGWTHTVTTTKLAKPIQTDDGPVSEAPSVIEWKASAGAGIKPGEFDQFQVSAGPLPKADSMTFKVIQVYGDGKQVAWVEESTGGAEPEHPAPVLTLAAAGSEAGPAPSAGPTVSASPAAAPASNAASKSSVTGAYLLGGLGLLAGLAGLALGLTTRRRADRQPTREPARTTTAR
jgi:periplasmic copper chaperone A